MSVLEKAACGVGAVINYHGQSSRYVVESAKTMLERMAHRGATGADENSGDGAGIMITKPDQFFRKKLKSKLNIDLPPPNEYATGLVFLRKEYVDELKKTIEEIFRSPHRINESASLEVIAWLDVDTVPDAIGHEARAKMPEIRQIFVRLGKNSKENNFQLVCDELCKKTMELTESQVYFCSLSVDVFVFKGCLKNDQLFEFYPDLKSEEIESNFAIIHSRFSTNTTTEWRRAQPLRLMAHNGEINTIRANRKYALDRQRSSNSNFCTVIEEGQSDSGCFDNVLNYLIRATEMDIDEAARIMMPPAYIKKPADQASFEQKYYEWAESYMEQWDGPALVVFTNGRKVGAVLDRNGLRPARFKVTRDGFVYLSSEVGVVDVDKSIIVREDRLSPGNMMVVDMFANNSEASPFTFTIPQRDYSGLMPNVASIQQLKEKLDGNQTSISNAKCIEQKLREADVDPNDFDSDRRLAIFDYSEETFFRLLEEMIKQGKEALGSMGNDAALACLSEKSPILFKYFNQLFAQVTNPPIDPFRERNVMTLNSSPFSDYSPFTSREGPWLQFDQPILSIADIEILKAYPHVGIIDTTFDIKHGYAGFEQVLERVCIHANQLQQERKIALLSDRRASRDRVPVPMALVVGIVGQSSAESRIRSGLIIESGEVREVHDCCVLLGYGADAICPYMVFETFHRLRNAGKIDMDDDEIFTGYKHAAARGILKVMAKMGISTLQSYKHAGIFEIVGLSAQVVDKCFKGTVSQVGGLDFKELYAETMNRHAFAYPSDVPKDYFGDARLLVSKGDYHWRSGGEKHINEPEAIAQLQAAVRLENAKSYKEYAEITNEAQKYCTLRGRWEIKFQDNSIPLEEVESAAEIVKKFATGAMSFGSISYEAHTTLAIAMNRIGGKSNTGEGGEDSARWDTSNSQFNMRSSIKQVASGRFGVTAAYLANADALQIKMAQGAKPGEGGELPGHKVTADIAATRKSTPGVGLISPPPHHDIYSIEDVAELIYDLKCANERADVDLKLVAESGVGLIACGVVKGKADRVIISGHDGGTGASSWTGIKHAGLPWELGLSETHRTLMENHLRSRVTVQVDGQIKTGRDVIIGALLGADEFGMATAPLIALGCTMMRKCHLNVCPVGIATQDPELRKKFEGKPEHVVNFMFFVAEEVREYLSRMGFRKLSDIVGRADLLSKSKNIVSRKFSLLNFSKFFVNYQNLYPQPMFGDQFKQKIEISQFEQKIVQQLKDFINSDAEGPLCASGEVTNEDRAFGARISYHIAQQFGEAGLPHGRHLHIELQGTAGQSFGAFLAKGVRVRLIGEANDYVGKGLSGGRIYILTPESAAYPTHENIIAGNAVLYGATSGIFYANGECGERFAVRNSGAIAVVEGAGFHACEYMTGGKVIILGSFGQNMAAGMSGGVAYFFENFPHCRDHVNKETIDIVEPTDDERKWVHNTIIDYCKKMEGRSVIGENILKNWASQPLRKVYPKDLQRVDREAKLNATPQIVESKQEVVNEKQVVAVSDIEDVACANNNIIKQPLDKLRGFMKYSRSKKVYRDAKTRLNDYEEVYDHESIKDGILVQAARCMDCGVPFCQSKAGCPLGNIIPQFNQLAFEQDWFAAYKTLSQTNNFPEFTGRACPAPCEAACTLAINAKAVSIKSIECTIIDTAFEKGWVVPRIPVQRTGKKVAVIGSGPAGLAAAAQLNQAGHTVTVFERSNRIGGLLMDGIPSMKIDKKIVDRRVKLLEDEGIIFKCNSFIGEKSDTVSFMQQYDAIAVCTGATKPRDINVPGRDAKGIVFAVKFLTVMQDCHNANNYDALKNGEGEMRVTGRRVIIIGGGDTATDCIATCTRLRAESVKVLELMPEPPQTRADNNPWPQWPRIFREDYGHEEVKAVTGKDPRVFAASTVEFGTKNGKVSSIKYRIIDYVTRADGSLDMSASKEIITEDCDIVILAMGFLGPEKALIDNLELNIDNRGNILTNPDYFQSSRQKVFAAGDCRRGQSLIVWAISEGREVARHIDQFLIGRSLLAQRGGSVPIVIG